MYPQTSSLICLPITDISEGQLGKHSKWWENWLSVEFLLETVRKSNVRISMLIFSYPPKEIHQIWISKFLRSYIVVRFFKIMHELSNKRYKNFKFCIFSILFHSFLYIYYHEYHTFF